MPNRIIKESICTSDTIDQLTEFEELFWYRLIVNCDDFGRFDARTSILKARLFPLKLAKVSDKTIEETLNKLSIVGLITVYIVEERPYLQAVTWGNHQTIRNKRSKYPSIEDANTTIEINCNQMNANVPVIQSNPIQSKSNPIQSHDASNEQEKQDNLNKLFEIFYFEYPKKKSKGDAEKAFKAIKPNKELVVKMVDKIRLLKKTNDWKKEQGKFIPYPATWLRAKGWEDEVKEVASETNSEYDVKR